MKIKYEIKVITTEINIKLIHNIKLSGLNYNRSSSRIVALHDKLTIVVIENLVVCLFILILLVVN